VVRATYGTPFGEAAPEVESFYCAAADAKLDLDKRQGFSRELTEERAGGFTVEEIESFNSRRAREG
jgi:hypothetical protein